MLDLAEPTGPGTGPVDWHWHGHRIRWIRSGEPTGSDAAAVLIHGFGASLGHWRRNLPVLSRQIEVYALDLLGFGASDKPRSRLADEAPAADSVRYCFDLWAEQVADFVQAKVGGGRPDRPVHLIGNSIGAVVALNAAHLLSQRGFPPAQVILIDCAQRTLDDKQTANQTLWAQASRPLLKGLVRQRWLIGPLFQLLARPDLIRGVLKRAYPSGANIDADLVALLHRPSTDPGAVESFRGFINLFNDHLAPDLLASLTLPVRMIWGEQDPWEDPEEARRWQRNYSCIRDLRVLEGLGHCPHDEAPERVNPILLEWLLGEHDDPGSASSPVQ